MPPHVKICGVRKSEDVVAAVESGAAYLGFVFFEKSPRNISLEQAKSLALHLNHPVVKVALTVNADNDALDNMTNHVPIDMLQLHGQESPERVLEIKARYKLPVMKAIGVGDASDLSEITRYEDCADQLLIDAKAPENGVLPGGNGLSFDWRLLQGRRWKTPWMLAGGLHAGNVAAAIALTKATQVDVSSGVELELGQKDKGLIRAFCDAARSQP